MNPVTFERPIEKGFVIIMATAKTRDGAKSDPGGVQLHSCEICGQPDLAKGALRRHVESVHVR